MDIPFTKHTPLTPPPLALLPATPPVVTPAGQSGTESADGPDDASSPASDHGLVQDRLKACFPSLDELDAFFKSPLHVIKEFVLSHRDMEGDLNAILSLRKTHNNRQYQTNSRNKFKGQLHDLQVRLDESERERQALVVEVNRLRIALASEPDRMRLMALETENATLRSVTQELSHNQAEVLLRVIRNAQAISSSSGQQQQGAATANQTDWPPGN